MAMRVVTDSRGDTGCRQGAALGDCPRVRPPEGRFLRPPSDPLPIVHVLLFTRARHCFLFTSLLT